MKLYTTVVLCLLFFLAVVFLWKGVVACRLAEGETEQKQRRQALQKAFLIMVPGVMFFFAALYVIFREGWLFGIAALIGLGTTGFAIGNGLKDNMETHGGN